MSKTFNRFQNSLPKIIIGLLLCLIIYFIIALIGNKGMNYVYALNKEVKELKNELNLVQQSNQTMKNEIELWEEYPNQMTEEYLVSEFAMKKKSASYFDALND